MGKRLTIGSRAVAVAILAEALREASTLPDDDQLTDKSCQLIADRMVAEAWDVEYKPVGEKLVITLNAGIASPDRMRSTPEDQPTPDVG